MFGHIYLILVGFWFVYIWINHYYLIHFKMNNYMLKKYPTYWNKMKSDTSWYRPTWATLYYTKAIYDFIWRSEEYFADNNIFFLKRKIKRIIWELPLFFIVVIFCSICLVWFGLL